MKAKTLFYIFIASIVSGFFLAAAGVDSGNGVVTGIGAVVLLIGGIAFGMWWNNPDRK